MTAPFDVAAARRLAHDHAATLSPDALPVLLALLAACDALDAAQLPAAPVATSDEHTGIAASWCPLCGVCACPRDADGFREDDHACPLHGDASLHAASLPVA